jgi:hypothetical protein
MDSGLDGDQGLILALRLEGWRMPPLEPLGVLA